ncbi:PD-(D/E)XK nuclease family transposase [uncultured Fibrobacter sp.]|uniref:PD-(D/E)XK nuclease family transposase n=1 Tax=uncultured Fibrobacter sp. TaxID=261512 RepID=UPI0026105430|nr:PD-(D/E)XK nuclease family transposase [uncultured Fibrobacter sp.]
MIREEFAEFLKELRKINDNGGDIDTFVKKHEHRNVYFYNDGCIKKILASEKNLMLTTDLVNAALGLIGSERIENPKLVNPFIPGELGYRNVEPDILLTNDRDGDVPRDRISIEVQHEDNKSLFKDRLVLYVARLTSNMARKGKTPRLENLNVISFLFFDAFPESANYRHTVQLRNQEQQVYFDKQTVTLIEVEKFFKKAQRFVGDSSRLAQWLRAIDTLNRDADFSEFANDPIFRLLQNEVKLCNFSSRYLMTVDMSDFDEAVARYVGAMKKSEEIAKKMRDQNEPIQKIASYTGLSEKTIREL